MPARSADPPQDSPAAFPAGLSAVRPVIREDGRVTTPDSHAPPVYACAAGAVVHEHSSSTLEPALLLHTFLPPGVEEVLRNETPRVDVSSDGPGAATVTIRVLAGSTSLSWSVPIGPVVAALPGQPGDDGRMVLLALVDSEPSASFWSDPIDCERLAAELQLPVADVAEALRGRLTPWLADDLELLLHDDAHDRAVDRSPAQTLATAFLAHYRGDLAAEQATTALVRALSLAPEDYTVELGGRLCAALSNVLQATDERAREQVLAQTGPFETEALRQLIELPPLLDAAAPEKRTETAMDFLLSAPDRDETVRAAVSVLGRLARAGLGADLPDEEVLRQLGMVDDRALARLARLWVDLAAAAAGDGSEDAAVAQDVAVRARDEGRPGLSWLTATSATLVGAGLHVVGKQLGRISGPVEAVRQLLDADDPSLDVLAEAAQACVVLARYVRSRGRVGPGQWLQTPSAVAASAVAEAWVGGLDQEVAVDLLDALLADDVEAVDLLDGLVCATAQLLIESELHDDPAALQTLTSEALTAVPAGSRGARWLLVVCLREAHDHDAAAPALGDFLPKESVDVERAAQKAGRVGLLSAGLTCLSAMAATFAEAGHLPREVALGMPLPVALVDHDLLRRPDSAA
ncbi:MAG: hypothetical protein JWM62_1109 [Frankiales bacterium]|nr:hypothetical protein [Frankiales bacterium]